MEKKSQESNVHLLLKIPYCFFFFLEEVLAAGGFNRMRRVPVHRAKKYVL